jgi:hypothetical protein
MISSSLESTLRQGVIEGYGNPVRLAGWGATGGIFTRRCYEIWARHPLVVILAPQPIRACK